MFFYTFAFCGQVQAAYVTMCFRLLRASGESLSGNVKNRDVIVLKKHGQMICPQNCIPEG